MVIYLIFPMGQKSKITTRWRHQRVLIVDNFDQKEVRYILKSRKKKQKDRRTEGLTLLLCNVISSNCVVNHKDTAMFPDGPIMNRFFTEKKYFSFLYVYELMYLYFYHQGLIVLFLWRHFQFKKKNQFDKFEKYHQFYDAAFLGENRIVKDSSMDTLSQGKYV